MHCHVQAKVLTLLRRNAAVVDVCVRALPAVLLGSAPAFHLPRTTSTAAFMFGFGSVPCCALPAGVDGFLRIWLSFLLLPFVAHFVAPLCCVCFCRSASGPRPEQLDLVVHMAVAQWSDDDSKRAKQTLDAVLERFPALDRVSDMRRIISESDRARGGGNDAFASGNYDNAAGLYSHAMGLIEHTSNHKLRGVLFTNRAAAYMALRRCADVAVCGRVRSERGDWEWCWYTLCMCAVVCGCVRVCVVFACV